MKTVLDVGNCAFDHAAIRRMIESHFDARVRQAHSADDALSMLRNQPVDLVLINRQLDRDGSEGVDLVERIKAIPELASTPIMLVTNFSEYQEKAVAAGAVWGFGKAQLKDAETRRRLSAVLNDRPPETSP